MCPQASTRLGRSECDVLKKEGAGCGREKLAPKKIFAARIDAKKFERRISCRQVGTQYGMKY